MRGRKRPDDLDGTRGTAWNCWGLRNRPLRTQWPSRVNIQRQSGISACRHLDSHYLRPGAGYSTTLRHCIESMPKRVRLLIQARRRGSYQTLLISFPSLLDENSKTFKISNWNLHWGDEIIITMCCTLYSAQQGGTCAICTTHPCLHAAQ